MKANLRCVVVDCFLPSRHAIDSAIHNPYPLVSHGRMDLPHDHSFGHCAPHRFFLEGVLLTTSCVVILLRLSEAATAPTSDQPRIFRPNLLVLLFPFNVAPLSELGTEQQQGFPDSPHSNTLEARQDRSIGLLTLIPVRAR